MTQNIPIITEQYHGNTWWFHSVSRAIAQRGAGYHLKTQIHSQGLTTGQIADLADVAFVASHSETFLRQATSVLQASGKRAILIMENGYNYGPGVSSVAPCHEQEARTVYAYLTRCARTRIALVGFRADLSRCMYSAMLKYAPDMGLSIPATACYFSRASKAYLQKFIDEACQYDAAICPNYQISLALLSLCKENGIRVPEDLYLIAYTNAISAQYTSPQLTTVSVDVNRVVNSCFELWMHMMRSPHAFSALCIHTPSWLRVRKSTDNIPFIDESTPARIGALKPFEDPSLPGGDVSKDPVMYDLEKCLWQCDSLDIDLIRLLLEGDSYETIAEKLFISVSSLRYRVNKLYTHSGTGSRRQFEQMFKARLVSDDPFAPS